MKGDGYGDREGNTAVVLHHGTRTTTPMMTNVVGTNARVVHAAAVGAVAGSGVDAAYSVAHADGTNAGGDVGL
jgi:hypothetical protein